MLMPAIVPRRLRRSILHRIVLFTPFYSLAVLVCDAAFASIRFFHTCAEEN